MTLRLTIDSDAWHRHQSGLMAQVPGLVPVVKGNGYGFGLDVLTRQAIRLKAATIAVGIAQEVQTVRLAGWTKDVVILNPWRPGDTVATALLDDPKVITTVSRVSDIEALRAQHHTARVIVELDTTMHRHGITADELAQCSLGGLFMEGWAIHLPATGSLKEATALAQAALAVREAPLWASHLSVDDYQKFRTAVGVQTRMRVGTRLWLGSPTSLETTATVLDVHPVSGGDRFGYHQVKAPRDGFLVIASGGTANGVALAAPVPQRSLRQRGVTVAEGLLEATGRSLSPFTVAGRKRPFAEPPHMHSSMLFVPGKAAGVEVGDEVAVTCRMTTTTFDEISWR